MTIKYEKLIFNAEIRKGDKYPDFVLHSGQDNADRQELIIEAKTQHGLSHGNSSLEDDLNKLIRFTSEVNVDCMGHYNAALFIAINMTNEELTSKIDNISSKFNPKEVSKIYCIGTDSEDFISLADLVNG